MCIYIHNTEIGALIIRIEGNELDNFGRVFKCTQFEGTEKEYSWYFGYVGEKQVRFEEFEDLENIVRRLMPGERVEVVY